MERLVFCGRRLVGRQDTELSHDSGESTRMFSKLFRKKGLFAAQMEPWLLHCNKYITLNLLYISDEELANTSERQNNILK